MFVLTRAILTVALSQGPSTAAPRPGRTWRAVRVGPRGGRVDHRVGSSLARVYSRGQAPMHVSGLVGGSWVEASLGQC
eukprot:scaffold4393_cov252-Prasinococcus_capsulatus_cf.AAC.2